MRESSENPITEISALTWVCANPGFHWHRMILKSTPILGEIHKKYFDSFLTFFISLMRLN